MRLVIDANVLVTYFWPNSLLQQALFTDADFYSPEFALYEIKEHKQDLMRRTHHTSASFQKMLEHMPLQIQFISSREYSNYYKEMKTFILHLPPFEQNKILKDIDYLTPALKLNCPLWTNDSLLKKQKGVQILTTKDIIPLL